MYIFTRKGKNLRIREKIYIKIYTIYIYIYVKKVYCYNNYK